MIALMKRILSVSGPYQGRIKLAFVFAFLKAMLSKAPIGLSFLALSAFLQGTMTARLCLWLAVGTVGCVLLECLCQNIADRLQAAAGYMVFADLRMELGRHLTCEKKASRVNLVKSLGIQLLFDILSRMKSTLAILCGKNTSQQIRFHINAG